MHPVAVGEAFVQVFPKFNDGSGGCGVDEFGFVFVFEGGVCGGVIVPTGFGCGSHVSYYTGFVLRFQEGVNVYR